MTVSFAEFSRILTEDYLRIVALQKNEYSPFLHKKSICFEEVVVPKVHNAVLRQFTNTNLESKGKAALFVTLNKVFNNIPGEKLTGIQTQLKDEVAKKSLEILCDTKFFRHLHMDVGTFTTCLVPKTLSSGEALEILLSVAFDHLSKARSPQVPISCIDPILSQCIQQNFAKDQKVTLPARSLLTEYSKFISSLNELAHAQNDETLFKTKEQWRLFCLAGHAFAKSSFNLALYSANLEFEALYEITERSKRRQVPEVRQNSNKAIREI